MEYMDYKVYRVYRSFKVYKVYNVLYGVFYYSSFREGGELFIPKSLYINDLRIIKNPKITFFPLSF